MKRHPLALALAVLIGLIVPALAAESPWFTRHLVGLEVGPTGAQFGHSDPTDARYAARFDGLEIVRRSVVAHSEYLVLWVRDGDYAYYDSKLLPKAPGLGARDRFALPHQTVHHGNRFGGPAAFSEVELCFMHPSRGHSSMFVWLVSGAQKIAIMPRA